jgi:acetyl-CoA carboxylase biotin carboxylase subunit
LPLKSGLPIVPGSSGPVGENVHKEAEEIGYPVIIKAASGGGGRGMKIVYSPEELDNAIELTQQESAAAFGDSTVYLEKFLESPRHIEVQVLADRHGNILHLGDRGLFATEKAPESNRRSSCNGYQRRKKAGDLCSMYRSLSPVKLC